jgi:hypothetical protein
MVGVNSDRFRDANPIYAGLSNNELADHINSELKAWLWPKTAHTEFGGKTYEVTYFYNPGTTADADGVLNINPYAAYDLIDRSWTVRPPELPADPRKLYPKSWWEQVDREADQARGIISRYNNARARATRMAAGSPGHVNALTEMRLATAQAHGLFDSIHTGRKSAFAAGGQGYGDFANFRWQAAKANGIGPALAAISDVARTAVSDASTALYGGPVEGAETALTKALLWTQAKGMS